MVPHFRIGPRKIPTIPLKEVFAYFGGLRIRVDKGFQFLLKGMDTSCYVYNEDNDPLLKRPIHK